MNNDVDSPDYSEHNLGDPRPSAEEKEIERLEREVRDLRTSLRLHGMSLIKRNALKDPDYSPYCMRCPGTVRMKKVEHLLWKHHCGAVHDERTKVSDDELRALWRAHGGHSHGPKVETATMPEAAILTLLRQLIERSEE